jgi:hypothetical protein
VERIDTVLPGVAAVLAASDGSHLRALARAAALEAVRQRPLDDRRAADALRAIVDGRFGATPERGRVRSLVDELDGRYWATRPEDDAAALEPITEQTLQAFADARAANVLWAALDADALAAALESLYETWAATGQDAAALRMLIDSLENPAA